ncbi:MAG: 6-oxocyclohex-1-ene-1-carbonyl-CoA hydratase [Thermoleophilia bacterium]|nr:6-oxocyclohex-1-ene-1-carbonyl-CoA hydratase [Thermoleophilia bacterium]
MSLDWLPRDNELKEHALHGSEHWGTEAPCTVYEKKPLTSPSGEVVEGLYVAWVRLNNPAQYNSYTTEMVKGVIAGFTNASLDRSVVAVVFTGTGDRAFCTGGNTTEYSEYYSKRPNEYGEYMDLFNAMVDSVLNCKKPVICRVNGMRVAGGQELGTACDIAVAADTAIFGQAGPRHGSAAVGGITDFLPWFLSIEDAMWSTVTCELWSAYKMKTKGLISKVVPVLRKDGEWVRNPLVRTDTYVEDGEIVYGEMVTGEAAREAKGLVKACTTDFARLDAAVDEITWKMAHLFPGSLQMSIDMVRAKKKFFWDQAKLAARHWLAANMMGEAFLGFYAFSTRKQTGEDVIDFLKYRQQIAQGSLMGDEAYEEVLPKPQ